MAALGNLPDELMIEILSRLPPESLLRFKSVQKCWYALINDSKFVAKHFSNSLHHHHVLLKHLVIKHLLAKNTGRKENIFSILKFPFSVNGSDSVLDVHLPFDDDFLFIKIRGHSHGLLCLSDIGKDIVLCNPTTREFRKLPPSILHLTEPPEEPDGYDSATNAVGFGYDPRSKDFKVVRVVDFLEGPGYIHPPRVEIYDLRKDRWREIESLVCGRVNRAPWCEMYLEGTYYWWANDDRGHEIIQTFDMSEEVFGRISVPEEFEENHEKHRSMGVRNGSIVLFHYPSRGDEGTFNIWEMGKDESRAVSWTKILTIGPGSGIVEPLLFVSSDEILMKSKERQVILYNVRTQRFKELPIKERQVPSYFLCQEFGVGERREQY